MTPLDSAPVRKPVQSTKGSSAPYLSEREAQVLDLIIEGMSYKQTAWQLGIAEQTVKLHVASAKSKLKAETIAHCAVIYARMKFLRGTADQVLKQAA